MIRLLRNWGLPVLSLALLLFGIAHVIQADKPLPSVEPPAIPPRSPYGQAIAASGLVEPRSENIAVGTPLPGVVLDVFVSASQTGTTVSKGAPLFRVDDRHLVAQLQAQQAQLESPRAQLARLESLPRPEEVKPAEFQVAAALAKLNSAEDAYQRAKRLVVSSAMSESELVTATQNQAYAQAELARAQSELALLNAGAWEPDKQIVRAAIREIESRIAQTQTEIDRSLVRAPMEAVVLQVKVRPGEFVGNTSGEALVVLGDPGNPHVRVDIDEADIPRFQSGGAARAFVRGDSSREVGLKFVRLEPYVIPKRALTGQSTERVDTRVLQVIYEVSADSPAVFIGQQLDVFIEVPHSKVGGNRSP